MGGICVTKSKLLLFIKEKKYTINELQNIPDQDVINYDRDGTLFDPSLTPLRPSYNHRLSQEQLQKNLKEQNSHSQQKNAQKFGNQTYNKQNQNQSKIKITDVTEKYQELLHQQQEKKPQSTVNFSDIQLKISQLEKELNEILDEFGNPVGVIMFENKGAIQPLNKLDDTRNLDQKVTQKNPKIKSGSSEKIKYANNKSSNNNEQFIEQDIENQNSKKNDFKQEEHLIYSFHSKMTVVYRNKFLFPIITFKQEYLDKVSKTQFNVKEILGITFIYEKEQTQNCYFEERLCQQHNSQIFHVCLEKSCTQKSLLCALCIMDHKQHNYVELKEIIMFVQGRRAQLQTVEDCLKKMFQLQARKIKETQNLDFEQDIFEKIESQLKEIKQDLRIYLQKQILFFEEVIEHLIQGGLTKITQSLAQIFQKEGTSLQLQQINFEFQQYLKRNNEVFKMLQQYQGHTGQQLQNTNLVIRIQGVVLEINSTLIQTYNDLDEQIKIELMNKNLYEFVFKDLMWLQESQVIRLCKNHENVEQSVLQNQNQLIITYIV